MGPGLLDLRAQRGSRQYGPTNRDGQWPAGPERKKHERVKRELAKTFDRLLGVFEYLIDLPAPGASERGALVSTWALKIAWRFSVPERYLDELRIAGRLHEIGRLAMPDQSNHRGARDSNNWSYVVSSGAILKRIQVLAEVGSLVESMYENWDGAGLANHWCQRQIPLRSRILRVVVDYFAALKRIGQVPGSSTLAFAEISRHSGTRMTPWSSTTWRCTHRRPRHPATASTERVAIHDLEVGMVLAHDLRTTRGVKLLPEGATLNEKTLEVVRRRHQTDPIIEGARILAFTAILATRRESCSMRRILPPFLMKDMTDDHVPSPFWRPPEGASALTPRWLNGGSAAQQLLVNLSLATTVQSIFRGVVHDVRNRLQVISMVGQTIAEAPDDAALVTKLAPMVVSASREIEADLERLALNPSREVLSPDSLSLSEVTNDVIQLIERLDSSPRVVVRLPHDLPAAQANTHHVSHTLLNLLLNAVEAAEPDECTITITATVTQNTIHLHLQDAGPGVPTHVRANIFDPFFTTKEINRHLGLGLPAARILAISWGGTLTLDSEVETGAKLTLTIPAVDDTPASRR